MPNDTTSTSALTKEIPLTKGKVALVDAEDYEWLMRYKWHATLCDGIWYAGRGEGPRGHGKRVYMHRQIVQPAPGLSVDHRNRNGLDNRRSNLRSATATEQQYNRGKPKHNTSGFKGVQRGRNGHGWQANIMINHKLRYLGQFPTKEEAAKAYDDAATEHYGEFAQTNAGLGV